MAERNWSGSFCTPMTPWDDKDRIDEDALRAEVRFCVESGVGGLCTPVMVSEFRLMSEDERRLAIRIPVEESGDVPVIANCAAVNIPLAVSYARYAEEVGADAVIAMPPYIFRQDFETVYAYYKAINDAVRRKRSRPARIASRRWSPGTARQSRASWVEVADAT